MASTTTATSPLVTYRENNPNGWNYAMFVAPEAGDRAIVLYSGNDNVRLMSWSDLASRVIGQAPVSGQIEHPIQRAMRTRGPSEVNLVLVSPDGSFYHARVRVVPNGTGQITKDLEKKKTP